MKIKILLITILLMGVLAVGVASYDTGDDNQIYLPSIMTEDGATRTPPPLPTRTPPIPGD